jgi:hypothetical protein
MNYLYAFFGVLVIFLIIYGLRSPINPNYSPDDADLRVKRNIYERFSNPSKSSNLEVQQGASTFYDWSNRSRNLGKDLSCRTPKPRRHHCEVGDIECEMKVKNVKVQNDYYIINKKEGDCNKCDIINHPDIDKYVLKTSVPPCPDVSKFALKSDMQPSILPDMNDYIKKNEIPPCEKCPDLSDYILKADIPAKVECPKCPACPVCPVCPICPKTYNNIEDDPKFKRYMNNFIKNFDLNKHPQLKNKLISKNECDKKLKDQKEKMDKELINKSKDFMKKIENLIKQQSPDNDSRKQDIRSDDRERRSDDKDRRGDDRRESSRRGDDIENGKRDTLKDKGGNYWNIITNSGKTQQKPNYDLAGSGDKNGPYCDKLQGYQACK